MRSLTLMWSFKMGMYTELQLNCELKKCDIGVAFALGETTENCCFNNVRCGMLQGESSYFPAEATFKMHNN